MNVDVKGADVIVDVGEELDHHQASLIEKELESILRKRLFKSLILDFSNTSFMDSSGVGLIIRYYKMLSMLGGNVCVIHVSPMIERLFFVSGLHKIIRINTKMEAE